MGEAKRRRDREARTGIESHKSKGKLGILNVGAGDTKLSFDPNDPSGREHAARVVTDMLKRGYAIMIEVGRDEGGEAIYKRAKGFDPKTCEYIIMGTPDPAPALDEAAPEEIGAPPVKLKNGGRAGKALGTYRGRGRPRKGETRVPAGTTNAVAISRSAGG